MTEPKNLICEIRLLDSGRLRLEIDGLLIDGEHALDAGFPDEIERIEDPQKAGARLFDALLPDDQPTLEAYRKITQEFRQLGALQRMRLHIEPEAPPWLHDLPWELLFDPRRRIGLGRSHDISFLRAVAGPDRALEPVRGKMRILVAVAGPSDVLQHNLPALDRRYEERTLVASLRRLHELLSCEILDAPVTVDRLRRRLRDGSFHTLHLVAHGRKLPHEDAARILLEDEHGHGEWVDGDRLSAALAQDADLHLVTLVACHDGIETKADPFHGLGLKLAADAAPAVVTTRRALTVSQAAKMTGHLYRGLALSGRIDEAVNEARERLFHSRPERRTWASPIAFLCGGRPFLWHSEEGRRQKVEEDTQALELVQFRLEQHRREQLAAVVEDVVPPPPKAGDPWRRVASALAILVAVLGLGLAGAAGFGPLAPLWQVDVDVEGLDLRARDSVDPEATRRAIPRYGSACDRGNALACARLGAIYDLGRGVDPDDDVAEGYYLKACELGDAGSCYHLGRLLESRADGADPTRAAELYERACAGDDVRACRRLTVQRHVVPDSIAQASPEVGAAPGALQDGASTTSPQAASTLAEADASAPAPTDGVSVPEPEAAVEATKVDETGESRKVPVDGKAQSPTASTMPALAHSTGDGTRWIYEVGGVDREAVQTGHARGNVYRVLSAVELAAWEVRLDFDDAQELTFSVHEATDDQGSFTSVLSRTVTVQGTGPAWYSSGDLSSGDRALRLEAGRSYLIAVSWNGEVGYAFGEGSQDLYFAELVHGHVDLDPILPEVESEAPDRAAYRQRLLVNYEPKVDGEARADLTRLHDTVPRPLTIEPTSPQAEVRAGFELGPWDLGAEARTESPRPPGGRGNVVKVDTPRRLTTVEMWLEPILSTTLTVEVAVADRRAGPFDVLRRESWTPAETAPGWYASPPLDLDLEAGRYYAVLYTWDESVYYRRAPSEAQRADGLGWVLHGMTTAQGSAPSASTFSPDRALYTQRWILAPLTSTGD